MDRRPDFPALARPSGTFAMLAIDQRESLRAMLATGDPADVEDDELLAFKEDVVRELSGRASALLVDRTLGLPALAAAGPLPSGCGLIVAADVLEQRPGVPVLRVTVDALAPRAALDAGASALKLLVPWRPSEPERGRRRLVEEFVALCRSAGLLALVEAIVYDDGLHPPPWSSREGVLAAASEMAGYDFDLYKAQVPTLGSGGAEEIRQIADELTSRIARPWVVLSNGVPPDRFADGVQAACRGGASGFLAGRAIWTSALDVGDRAAHLAEVSARRLEHLAAIVDEAARPWPTALDNPT